MCGVLIEHEGYRVAFGEVEGQDVEVALEGDDDRERALIFPHGAIADLELVGSSVESVRDLLVAVCRVEFVEVGRLKFVRNDCCDDRRLDVGENAYKGKREW